VRMHDARRSGVQQCIDSCQKRHSFTFRLSFVVMSAQYRSPFED